MNIHDTYTEIFAGEYAQVWGGDVRVYDDAESVVFQGEAQVNDGGRAIILFGAEGWAKLGGQIWVCKHGTGIVDTGGEAFVEAGSHMTVMPGGTIHQYSEEEWAEAAALTWRNAGGKASTFYFGEQQ